MKFCMPHWNKLKDKIEEQGMSHLISKNGHEIVERMKEGKFDPLMSCHNIILRNAVENGGTYLLKEKPDSDDEHYCPLCELDKHSKTPKSSEWIKLAVKEALEYCRENKLLKPYLRLVED